jgi:predicted RNase H-like HicB family nuclease
VKSYAFRVVIEEDAFENSRKAYHAYCPALKGCHTWGPRTTKLWQMFESLLNCTWPI